MRVVLGVGVPFKRFGKEQAKLVAYLKRSGPHFIEFEEEDYVITIENVYCFPQCFAAVAETTGGRVPESVAQNFILGKDVKEIIISKLKAFATDIEGMLEESGLMTRTGVCVILLRNVIVESKKNAKE